MEEFYGYWSEKKIGGKKTLFEMQKTFDVDRRLVNWVKRDYNGTYANYIADQRVRNDSIKQQKQEQKYTEESSPEEFSEFMRSTLGGLTKGMKGN